MQNLEKKSKLDQSKIDENTKLIKTIPQCSEYQKRQILFISFYYYWMYEFLPSSLKNHLQLK